VNATDVPATNGATLVSKRFAYVHADRPNAPYYQTYAANPRYSSNGLGLANRIRRIGIGSYEVELGGMIAWNDGLHEAVLVSAVNVGPVRCFVYRPSGLDESSKSTASTSSSIA
jgi:hypothetical protein